MSLVSAPAWKGHVLCFLKALGLMLTSPGPYLGANGVLRSWPPIPASSAKAAISAAKQAYADLVYIYIHISE